jgi:hypothetical protein
VPGQCKRSAGLEQVDDVTSAIRLRSSNFAVIIQIRLTADLYKKTGSGELEPFQINATNQNR